MSYQLKILISSKNFFHDHNVLSLIKGETFFSDLSVNLAHFYPFSTLLASS